jgi:hypothetical protein
MRIAACFAGQPRFINECAPSILQNVFKDQQVDVFAHLWFCDELHNETFKYGGDGGWEDYRIPKTAIDDFIQITINQLILKQNLVFTSMIHTWKKVLIYH